MQYLNNDIEELMRKAAEHIPVQPKGADWNAVLQQLKEGNKPAAQQTEWNNSKRFLLLLCFLLASLVCNRFNKMQPPVEKNSGVLVRKATNENKKVTADELNTESNISTESVVIAFTKMKTNRQQKVYKNLEKTSWTFGYNKDNPVAEASVSNSELLSGQPLIDNQHRPANNTLEQATNKAGNEVATNKEIEESKAEAVEEKSAAAATVKLTRPRKLYASLLAGPDISTVKWQKIQGTGYSVGLMLGYRFGKNWAIEAGALWDRKKYYSEGAYFKTEKIYLPPHSEILEVEGYCDMVEIPINLRYNFRQDHKGNLFAIGGLSSYLMQVEDYDYAYSRYNTQYNSSKYYTQASREWFSVLNLSVGYERALGNAGKVRVEPYVKVPLAGMGVGDMPLTSTGIYVGFTRAIR